MNRLAVDYDSPDYTVELKTDSNESLNDLITKELRTSSSIVILYYLILVLTFLGLIYSLDIEFFDFGNLADGILDLSIGIVLGVLSIFVHELLHGFAYKMVGAINVKFTFKISPFKVFTSAHKFVLKKEEYILILAFPFIIVCFNCIIFSIYTSISNTLMFSFLMMHTLLCSGDFALISVTQNRLKTKSYVYYDSRLEQLTFLTKK